MSHAFPDASAKVSEKIDASQHQRNRVSRAWDGDDPADQVRGDCASPLAQSATPPQASTAMRATYAIVAATAPAHESSRLALSGSSDGIEQRFSLKTTGDVGLFRKLLSRSKSLNAVLGDVIYTMPQEHGACSGAVSECDVGRCFGRPKGRLSHALYPFRSGYGRPASRRSEHLH
jgi:hypothetical protein